MVTVTDQNLVIDKASRIIDVISLHLDENPQCQHKLDEILKDIDNLDKNGLGPLAIASPIADDISHRFISTEAAQTKGNGN